MTFKDLRLVGRAVDRIPRWITPNGITVFRGLLAVPVTLLLLADQYWPSLPLLTVALMLDFVDGILARQRNLTSEYGAFLDPLADKLLICLPLCTLAFGLSWPFVIAALGTTTMAIAGTTARLYKLWLRRRRVPLERRGVAATNDGKIKMTAECVGLLLLLLAKALALPALTWVALAALAVALRYAALSLKSQWPRRSEPNDDAT